MRIGDLNKRITFQCPTRVSDGMGGFTTIWVDVYTVFAAIWPLSATKVKENMQMGLNVTHQIRIRYKSTIKASWRGKFGNFYYNIVSIINPNMKNEQLDLVCKEAGN